MYCMISSVYLGQAYELVSFGVLLKILNKKFQSVPLKPVCEAHVLPIQNVLEYIKKSQMIIHLALFKYYKDLNQSWK